MYKEMYENISPRAGPMDVLGHPVRVNIVSRLLACEDASLDELAHHADVHRNTVRTHAALLEELGVLERSWRVEGSRRGRPRTCYRLAAGADHPFADFQAVSQLLSGALSAAGVDARAARRLGRELARSNVRRRARTRWASQLAQELGRFGFRATVDEGTVLLQRCPCATASPGAPELVCNLVSGFADGALGSLGTTRRVNYRESTHDPERRRCALALGSDGRVARHGADP
jgi:predicted ArsR family transcriptional regulator